MVRVVDCHAGVLGSNPGGPKIFSPWNYFISLGIALQMRQGFLREIAMQSFLQQYLQRYIIIVTFFLKCSISNRSSSKFFAERHVCIASQSAL